MITLIIMAVLAIVLLLVWAYMSISDPVEVDQEELSEVEHETPQEHAQARQEERERDVKERLHDLEPNAFNDPDSQDAGDYSDSQ